MEAELAFHKGSRVQIILEAGFISNPFIFENSVLLVVRLPAYRLPCLLSVKIIFIPTRVLSGSQMTSFKMFFFPEAGKQFESLHIQNC